MNHRAAARDHSLRRAPGSRGSPSTTAWPAGAPRRMDRGSGRQRPGRI